MPSKRVKEALEAFEALDEAQTRWEETYSELSEKEVDQLEKLLFAQGVRIGKEKVKT
jgi:hypothetical protein